MLKRAQDKSVVLYFDNHSSFMVSHYPLGITLTTGTRIMQDSFFEQQNRMSFERDNAHVLLSLKREIEAQLERWYPGCVLPIPDSEVDADVMREWSELQERV